MSGRKNYGDRWNYGKKPYWKSYNKYGSAKRSLPDQKKVTKAWHEFELWKLKRAFLKKEKKTLADQTIKDEEITEKPSESTTNDATPLNAPPAPPPKPPKALPRPYLNISDDDDDDDEFDEQQYNQPGW